MKYYFAFIISILFAIENYAGEYIAGIKGGISLSQYSFEWGVKTNGSATIFGEKAINKFLYNGIQINYYIAGGHTQWGSDFKKIIFENIGLGYNFIIKYPQKQFTPYLSAGVSFDYLVNNETSSIYPITNKMNIRPLISIGTENNLGRFKIVFEYLYSYNLLSYNATYFNNLIVPMAYTPLKFMVTLHIFNIGLIYTI